MTIILSIILVLWYISGVYGCILLFRSSWDLTVGDLIPCLFGGISGPILLFLGLAESGKFRLFDKVILKKIDKRGGTL